MSGKAVTLARVDFYMQCFPRMLFVYTRTGRRVVRPVLSSDSRLSRTLTWYRLTSLSLVDYEDFLERGWLSLAPLRGREPLPAS